ncbi:hypothetical protein [Thermocoleostomius sinensis]|uniref:Uncharacterized protein n=1 Tax=Thermocoleostomius sinensis A174 TaxID=2016057 RepID=A0A9E9CC42_9CYAN|nr:hypothetical protein [Thermocoleostomius sinensis]WAL61925.1 hypothetical protein OXH18_08055 [Thermocoleostomius sinensis A174]
MNWYSQLTQLILSFYREDPAQLQRLEFLHRCKVSRRWGVVRIHCRDSETANLAIAASYLLKEPMVQLRLAQEIKVFAKGEVVQTLPIASPKLRPQFWMKWATPTRQRYAS